MVVQGGCGWRPGENSQLFCLKTLLDVAAHSYVNCQETVWQRRGLI